MPPRRTISTNAGRSTLRRRRLYKKRGTAMARMRYARPTARNQKKFILRNASMVNRLTRHYNNSKLYCDYRASYPKDGNKLTTQNWWIQPITEFSEYDPVMRQNVTALAANHTYIRNIQVTCQAALDKSPALFFNCFLVRLRWQTAQRDFQGPLTPDVDYIDNAQNPGEMIQLNPSTFKVIAKKQFRLMTNNPADKQNPSPTTGTVGDLSRCLKRWVWNFNAKIKVSNPGAGSWKSVPYKQLPYYNRIFMLAYVKPYDDTAGDIVPFTMYTHMTTINVE